MIFYTIAIAFVLGLLRWGVGILPVLTIAAVVVDLGVGSGWNFAIWQPTDPNFIRHVSMVLVVNAIVCVVGHGAGRLIALAMGRLAQNFRRPVE